MVAAAAAAAAASRRAAVTKNVHRLGIMFLPIASFRRHYAPKRRPHPLPLPAGAREPAPQGGWPALNPPCRTRRKDRAVFAKSAPVYDLIYNWKDYAREAER